MKKYFFERCFSFSFNLILIFTFSRRHLQFIDTFCQNNLVSCIEIFFSIRINNKYFVKITNNNNVSSPF